MKKLTKIVSLLLAVALCVLLPNTTALTASADGPVTYYVKYMADKDEWRFQVGSTWSDSAQHRELHYLRQDIKDGDLLVVDGNNPGDILDIPVRLSNLTVFFNSTAIVTAKSIDNCYVLSGAVCAVNGNVTNAYAYEYATCTFNNNVGTLSVLNEAGKNDATLHGNVSAGGTVDHLIGHDGNKLHYELYNFAAGKLVIDKGDVKTDAAHYSTTPSSTQSTPAAPSQEASSADEYDDVPKTGDSSLVLWLLGISAICFAGSFTMKKKQY